MKQYLDIIKNVLENGEWADNRTDIPAKTCIHLYFTHDMSKGFPLLTTRKIPLKSVAIELEGFLKGITSKKWYQERFCKYWDYWCNPKIVDRKLHKYITETSTDEEIKRAKKEIQKTEDDLGTFYAHQIRRFNEVYDEDCNGQLHGIDQLSDIVRDLKNDSNSRRMICLNHNPAQVKTAALPACHVLWKIRQLNGKLHLSWFQRSADLMLGLPSNIASYALLLLLLCKESGFTPGQLTGFIDDCHIYKNHIWAAEEQVKRNTYPLPTVEIPDIITLDDKTEQPFSIFNWTHKNFTLNDYTYWPTIKMDIAV